MKIDKDNKKNRVLLYVICIYVVVFILVISGILVFNIFIKKTSDVENFSFPEETNASVIDDTSMVESG